MRWTVIISEMLFFWPAIILLVKLINNNKNNNNNNNNNKDNDNGNGNGNDNDNDNDVFKYNFIKN